jgi:hypothetical protein
MCAIDETLLVLSYGAGNRVAVKSDAVAPLSRTRRALNALDPAARAARSCHHRGAVELFLDPEVAQ